MNKELIDRICKQLPNGVSMEDSDSITIDEVDYDWCVIEELPTEDEGKYQFGGTIYGVGHKSKEGYGIVGDPLFYVEQDFTQTGSYYSYQERTFDKPYVVEKKEKIITVWEAVR